MTTAREHAAGTAGATLAAAARVLGAALDRRKPLHPHGDVFEATLDRVGSDVTTGVPLLDRAGSLPAIVRISRGVGLPEPLPDVSGLAIRVDPDGRPADLLLASTGTRALDRFLLAPRLRGVGATSSLLPYRSSLGPLNVAAFPVADGEFELCWAVGAGRWHPFAALRLEDPLPDAPDLSFDAILNVPDGLEHYPVVRRLRRPAYRAAREQSGRDRPAPGQPAAGRAVRSTRSSTTPSGDPARS